MNSKLKPYGLLLLGALIAALFGACASAHAATAREISSAKHTGKASMIVISVRDQKLTVISDGEKRVSYGISTSKFGLGDKNHSWETPLGKMEIASKIGSGAPIGSVFHNRVRTGEIVKINAPGRDPIVTRILALRGLEASNAKAFDRGIYIHGTAAERSIGAPSSYGCIRMRSKDIVQLYEMVSVGTKVYILNSKQNQAIASSSPLLNSKSSNFVAAVSNKRLTSRAPKTAHSTPTTHPRVIHHRRVQRRADVS